MTLRVMGGKSGKKRQERLPFWGVVGVWMATAGTGGMVSGMVGKQTWRGWMDKHVEMASGRMCISSKREVPS